MASAFSYFQPPSLPKYAIGFLKRKNKNLQILIRFADDLLTVYWLDLKN